MLASQNREIKKLRSSAKLASFNVFVAASSLLVLTACGGGSGDAQPAQPNNLEVQSLDHVSDKELQRAAASGSKQMRTGMNNVQRFAQSPAIADSMNQTNATGMLSQLLGMSGGAASNEFNDSMSADEQSIQLRSAKTDESAAVVEAHTDLFKADDAEQNGVWDDSNTDQLIDVTLGLFGDADITRDGNRLSVDPDDFALCELASQEVTLSLEETQFCLAMATDLRVNIDAEADDAGVITYFFKDTSVLSVRYAPDEALYKIDLAGLHTVLKQANAIAPLEFENVPEKFEGVIELDVRIQNEMLGQEAGSINFAVTTPIAIEDQLAGAGVYLAESNLVRFESDEALGTASIEMDAGAASYYFTDGQRVELVSSGSSVKIDMLDDGDRISVTKLGFGRGPLTVTVDSVEVVRVTLANFGFDIDTLTEQLQLTSALDFNVMINLVSEYFGESGGTMGLGLSVSAPTNATFTTLDSGSIKLDNAGPVNMDWYSDVDGQTTQGSFLAQQGECFTEAYEGNALFSLVVCD